MKGRYTLIRFVGKSTEMKKGQARKERQSSKSQAKKKPL
jgi:hypothetical protein